MNAILLSLALLGQFNMGGRSSSADLMMAGQVSSRGADLMMGGEVAAVIAKRPLHFYGPSWCPNCPGALATVQKELGQEFDIKVFKDYDSYPAWVIAQGQKSGWGYPMVHWTTNADAGKIIVWSGVDAFRKADGKPMKAVVGDESAPTPGVEVERVIGLLPSPQVGFVDFGCGDGRWCIAAAERWPGCRVTGIEIDPARAAATRERVQSLGLNNRITIITGDAVTTDVDADVATIYLYPEIIEKLIPRLKSMKACASYLHEPVGLGASRNGDSWLYFRQKQSASAVWGGAQYSGPVCNDPRCKMCNSIRSQIGIQPPTGSVWWSLLESKR